MHRDISDHRIRKNNLLTARHLFNTLHELGFKIERFNGFRPELQKKVKKSDDEMGNFLQKNEKTSEQTDGIVPKLFVRVKYYRLDF